MTGAGRQPCPDPVPWSEVGAFVTRQLEGLGELDFVRLVPLTAPLDAVEVIRLESGTWSVRVPLRPPERPLPMVVRERLDGRGYRVVDASVALGERTFDQPADAAAGAASVLGEVFGHPEGEPFDLFHGSRRPERDAAAKMVELHAAIEPVLSEFLGRSAVRDADGDYLVPHHGLTVVVAPRVAVGGVPFIRVATISNVGINVTPELGLLLANLNFGLALGRFALDTEHAAIWFDETLLGDDLTPSSLKLSVEVVAHTAADWAGRFRQLFGGTIPAQAAGTTATTDATERRKPGQGGYL